VKECNLNKKGGVLRANVGKEYAHTTLYLNIQFFAKIVATKTRINITGIIKLL